ncbi:MAG: PQQ-like beta-propeller repeat protein [Oscillospiraceae bacterium]|nr:PQQ-like beta-propeller repeat protein [Oscillospiraceae bacterium]
MNIVSRNKLLDLDNDGMNMAVDENHLYIRCKKAMYKYTMNGWSLAAHNDIFKKDGKARGFSICEKFVFLTDFCDLHILEKGTLQTVEAIRLGADLSSDLGTVRFDSQKVYICIRNGKIAVMDLCTRTYEKYEICESSFWDHCVAGNRIYAGTVQGELLEVDTDSMKVTKKAVLGKKNIYSVVPNEELIYTVSQDMTIKAIDIESFEIASVAKKAVRGMAKILGIHKNHLVVADSNKISLWDRHTLQFCDVFDFPTGHFNKGAALDGNRLFGSDYQSVYCAEME